MLNKSLFTAMIRSIGNAGGCGCVPSAESKPIYNINADVGATLPKKQ